MQNPTDYQQCGFNHPEDYSDDFDMFMGKVDAIMLNTIGLDHQDLADQNYMVMFEVGYTPGDVVAEVLDNEMGLPRY